MHKWMLDAPTYFVPESLEAKFLTVLRTRNPELLPPDVPRWVFLQWVVKQGYLLHGSKANDITEFEPRKPHDLGPDEFSKREAVFAASDGLWAMMFALRDKALVKLTQSLAQQVHEGDEWSAMKYFLSFGPRDMTVTDGRKLMTPGYVYILPGDGFVQGPIVHWPGLGECLEAQWVNPNPVIPLFYISVTAEDFPLPVRVHNPDRIAPLADSDPWGFPWLEDE